MKQLMLAVLAILAATVPAAADNHHNHSPVIHKAGLHHHAAPAKGRRGPGRAKHSRRHRITAKGDSPNRLIHAESPTAGVIARPGWKPMNDAEMGQVSQHNRDKKN